MASPCRSLLACALLSLLAPACGGGGGGGGGASPLAPTLLAATWIGSGAGPSAGDFLELFFSQDVQVRPSTALDGNDLALSAGSLGTIVSAPTQTNARVLRLTLGVGVSFVAGATTLDIKTANDAIESGDGKLALPDTARTIAHADGVRPVVSRLTLNGIDSLLNGTGPAGGTLQVPRSGFTIDLAYSDASGVDTAHTVLVASVAVETPSGARLAGTDLADALAATASSSASSHLVPDGVAFPEGACTLTAYVIDVTGLVGAPAIFSFTVRAATDALRPLEGGQQWFLDLARDLESYTVNLANPTLPVGVVAGANGRPDLEDLLLVIGLHSLTPLPNVSGTLDSNQYTLLLIKAQIQTELTALYAGANVTFTFTAPGTFPNGQSSVPYASLAFSQICIGGAENPTGVSGVLGVALFDPHNANQDNDCLVDFSGQRLGVFLHTMINTGMQPPSSSVFRTTYDALTPARSGTPLGNDSQDGARLLGTLQDARATTLGNAIARMARFAAVVAAHEMGHSVGLVKDSAMPNGLYGGDPVNFPGSTSGHIRMPASVFPAGSTNVMSPSLSFDTALSSSTTFDTLNTAYLRERVIVN